MPPHRLAIVASHVIQYQDPFFRLLAADPDVDLTVLYCSQAGAQPFRDEDMKTTLRWDIDLLTGYEYQFLRNLASDSNGRYFRLVNPGIVTALIRGRYDAAIFFTGWGSVTALLGMVTCKLFGIPFFLYGDSSMPPPEISRRDEIRAEALRALFAMTTGFMTSGVRNADYYAHYGADRRTFFLLPWAIDNDRFANASLFAPGERAAMRARYGIRDDQIAFLFSAKLVERKDPFTLLRAFEQLPDRDRAALVFMGDGELRAPLETYARERGLGDVRFAGFINQADIPKHYAMCDVFVLPSIVEPRGAVINEAMVCGLPVIVTDRCGSIGDIVLDGDNAFVYPAGDAAALSGYMSRLAGDSALRGKMARRSREIIDTWTFARGVEGVKAGLRWVRERKQT